MGNLLRGKTTKALILLAPVLLILFSLEGFCRDDMGGPGSGWQVIDPGGGGFVSSVAVDSRDDDWVWASTNVSGVRMSKDGGESWRMVPLPRSEYEQYGRQAQQIQERLAVHPKRPGLLLFAVKQTRRFPGKVYAYSEKDNYFQSVYTPDRKVGPFSEFVFDPYCETGDTVYTALGDIHFVDGSDYSHRHVGERKKRGFRQPSGTLVLRLKYSPQTKQWESKRLYEGNDHLHIYSMAIRRLDHKAPKEFFFTTDDGLYRAELDEPEGNLKRFRRWQPSPIIPKDGNFVGGKIVYDPRNKHFYLTAISDDKKQRATRKTGGLFVSFDDGKSWVWANERSKTLGRSPYFFDIGLHPQNPDIVYVAMKFNPKRSRKETSCLYRSVDGGLTWQNAWDYERGFEWGWMRFGAGSLEGRVNIRWPVGVDLVSVGKCKVYVTASLGQIFVKKIAGGKWKQITTRMTKDGGWTTTGFQAIAVPQSIGFDPVKPEELFIPYGDHGFFRTVQGKEGLFVVGQNEDYRSTYSGYVEVNHNNPKVLYFATRGPHVGLEQGSVIRGDLSLPNDRRWQFIAGCHRKSDGLEEQHGLTRGPMTSLFVEHNNGTENLYVTKYIDRPEGASSKEPGDSPGVYVLKDAEAAIQKGRWKWALISSGITFPLCMKPADQFKKLIVGTNGAENRGGEDKRGHIYVLSREENGRWQQQRIFEGQVGRRETISTIYDIDYCSDNKMIYFASEKGTFKLDLEGRNLERVGGTYNKEVTCLEINTTWPNILYMGGEFIGLFRSQDYGKSWQDLTPHIETPAIYALELDSANDRVYAITCNNGIWTKSFRNTK